METLLDELKTCFKEDFTKWLLRSNNPKIRGNLNINISETDIDYWINWLEQSTPFSSATQENVTKSKILREIAAIERESLEEIIDILLEQPLADYFWYSYPEHGGHLHYSLPNCEVVPGDSLRVDGEKIKPLLREIKLDKLLN